MADLLPTHGARSSPFPPIADYGFLSDCEVTALVASGGSVEWMCLPRMDSPSVFGATLDRDAGTFRIGPAGVEVPAARRYIPGTLILETSWWTPGGWLIVRDALLMGNWHHETERSTSHRRAPTDYDADHVLLRVVRCVNGEVQLRMDCAPVFDYGRGPAEWRYTGSGYHEAVAHGQARISSFGSPVTSTSASKDRPPRLAPWSRRANGDSSPSPGVSTRRRVRSRRPASG